MKKGFISNFIGRCPKALASVLVFMLAGVSFMNTQLNFDIPASTKVRDAAGFVTPFAEIEKMDVREIKTEIATNYVSSVPSAGYRYAPAAYTASASAPASSFHISEPSVVNNPNVDAGYGVMRYIDTSFGYRGNFLYAHSNLAFSPIKSLGVGDYFTATIDGATATYRVSARYVYNKAGKLSGNGDNNRRRDQIYRAKDFDAGGVQHSLSLMTCGNGYNDDSNFRLVLFADRV